MLLKRPDFLSLVKFSAFSGVSALTSYFLMNAREKHSMNGKNVIVTTGCDSGLGFSIAIYCHEKLNMCVISCVNNHKSRGALKLREMFGNSNRFHMIELEITKDESIEHVRKYVENFMAGNVNMGNVVLHFSVNLICFF
jgi:3-hydroxybutyrate dehydrogenase